MYRDQSLLPKEAVRLAALGCLLKDGPMSYADLALAVRHFVSRIVGPSLEMLGPSLETLRHEGLIAAANGGKVSDNTTLTLTDDGRAEFETLLCARIRVPASDSLSRLVLALKMRFLHTLDPAKQAEQGALLTDAYESELARLEDLHRHHAGEEGHLPAWLEHQASLIRAELAWVQQTMLGS